MLKRGSISWVIWNIVEALLLIVGGVLCWIYCNNADFQKTILLIVGIILAFDALLRLILGLVDVIKVGDVRIVKTDYIQAAAGAFELSLGILLILFYTQGTSVEILFQFLGLYIGIFLTAVGAVALIYSLIFMIRRLNNFAMNFASFLSGGIILACGILAIIYLTKQETIMIMFLVILGISLVSSGLGLLALTSIVRKETKVKNAIKDTVEDIHNDLHEHITEVEASDVKDETSENK